MERNKRESKVPSGDELPDEPEKPFDPNENIEEQRKISSEILNFEDKLGKKEITKSQFHDMVCTRAVRLAELVKNLDEHLFIGGEFPDRWADLNPDDDRELDDEEDLDDGFDDGYDDDDFEDEDEDDDGFYDE
jgi:hypothetical protein